MLLFHSLRFLCRLLDFPRRHALALDDAHRMDVLDRWLDESWRWTHPETGRTWCTVKLRGDDGRVYTGCGLSYRAAVDMAEDRMAMMAATEAVGRYAREMNDA
jgi:hypothetical protein